MKIIGFVYATIEFSKVKLVFYLNFNRGIYNFLHKKVFPFKVHVNDSGSNKAVLRILNLCF